MSSYFSLSVEFLDARFHGCLDGGKPEWPPSPLRLFQALVAAAARGRAGELPAATSAALQWLAERPAPEIIAPIGELGQPVQLSVPNNAMDIVAAAWSRGNTTGKDASPATHRAMKSVRPRRFQEGERLTYLWSIDSDIDNAALDHVECLMALARELFALGWGIDLVAGSARVMSPEEACRLSGTRWCPHLETEGDDPLRVPNRDTLSALLSKHDRFLHRIESRGIAPVPPLPGEAFVPVAYRRDTEVLQRPVAPFSLLRPDADGLEADGFRPFGSLQPHVVAGMLRHVAGKAARDAGWNEDKINAFVLGHSDGAGGGRFAYLPLPSIETRGGGKQGTNRVVTAIRRVLVVAPPGCGDEIAWIRRALTGRVFIQERTGKELAILSLLPGQDWTIRQYTTDASTWSTVTPVILPGHDDHKPAKTEALLRKALRQAGYPRKLAELANLQWRNVGFLPGVDLASRYRVPPYLEPYSRYHVRLEWSDGVRPISLPGPLAIGGGRFCGLGLFAAVHSER